MARRSILQIHSPPTTSCPSQINVLRRVLNYYLWFILTDDTDNICGFARQREEVGTPVREVRLLLNSEPRKRGLPPPENPNCKTSVKRIRTLSVVQTGSRSMKNDDAQSAYSRNDWILGNALSVMHLKSHHFRCYQDRAGRSIRFTT
jgi:hypothetical protein